MGHEPFFILTDQDVAVKAAVERVFEKVVHRFCMWHIVFKVPSKVTNDVYDNDQFRNKFNKLVWSNEFSQEEFKETWHTIIAEFGLESNTWLPMMFELHHIWIPAFFKDVNMGGLLRTTSRSKSQNFFFLHCIGSTSSLVIFMMLFESVIESQRHNQQRLDFESSTCFPTLMTSLELEKHCASVYIINVFYDVQTEIVASVFECGLSKLVNGQFGRIYVVQLVLSKEESICSCNTFMNIGIPCCLMFLVFKNIGLKKVPTKYIKTRWTNKSTLTLTFEIEGSIVEQSDVMDEKKLLITDLLVEVHSCINVIENNKEHFKELVSVLKEKKASYVRILGGESFTSTRQSSIQMFLGNKPSVIKVHPHEQAVTKGRKKERRILGGKEKAMKKAK